MKSLGWLAFGFLAGIYFSASPNDYSRDLCDLKKEVHDLRDVMAASVIIPLPESQPDSRKEYTRGFDDGCRHTRRSSTYKIHIENKKYYLVDEFDNKLGYEPESQNPDIFICCGPATQPQ